MEDYGNSLIWLDKNHNHSLAHKPTKDEKIHGTTAMLAVNYETKVISAVVDGRFCVSKKMEWLGVKEKFFAVKSDDEEKIVMIGERIFAIFYGNVEKTKMLIHAIKQKYVIENNMKRAIESVREEWANTLKKWERSEEVKKFGNGVVVAGFENGYVVLEWLGAPPNTIQFSFRKSKVTLFSMGEGKEIAMNNFLRVSDEKSEENSEKTDFQVFDNMKEARKINSDMTDGQVKENMEASLGLASMFCPATDGFPLSILLGVDGEIHSKKSHAIFHVVKHFASLQKVLNRYGILVHTRGVDSSVDIQEFVFARLFRSLLENKPKIVLLSSCEEERLITHFVYWPENFVMAKPKEIDEACCMCVELMASNELGIPQNFQVSFSLPEKTEFQKILDNYDLWC